MNKEQFALWVIDIRHALHRRYTQKETQIIIDWFETIKGSKERDLIGYGMFHEIILPLMDHLYSSEQWCMYHSMNIRVWIYAPYIIKEYNKQYDKK